MVFFSAAHKVADMEGTLLTDIWQLGLGLTYLAVQITGIVIAGRVVLSDRSSHGTVAWVISLLLLPLVGVPLYILFGRNHLRSYIKSRRRVDLEFKVDHHIDPHHPKDYLELDEKVLSNWRILGDLAKVPMTRGNDVTYLFSGKETYQSLLEGIKRARHYVAFQFFIFRDDLEGRRFTDLLKQKSREGVKVYFMVDAIGSRQLKKTFFLELEQAGIETSTFLPGRTWRGRSRLNFRNHRKVVVVDGCEAWLGGHNIGNEYISSDLKAGKWRDTHGHVRGPVVNAIQFAFLEDWYWTNRRMPAFQWDAASPQPANVSALCLATGPADPAENCTLAFVHLINKAQERLWIHSPYFVPSEEVIIALELATLRGVDVRILLPLQFDQRLVWICSYYYSSLPRLRKVRFFRYREGFLHSKMLLVDDEIVAVGTVNFDNRSFRINFEITLFVHNSAHIETCRAQMEKDFDDADEDEEDPLSNRSVLFRVAAHSIRLFSPLL